MQPEPQGRAEAGAEAATTSARTRTYPAPRAAWVVAEEQAGREAREAERAWPSRAGEAQSICSAVHWRPRMPVTAGRAQKAVPESSEVSERNLQLHPGEPAAMALADRPEREEPAESPSEFSTRGTSRLTMPRRRSRSDTAAKADWQARLRRGPRRCLPSAGIYRLVYPASQGWTAPTPDSRRFRRPDDASPQAWPPASRFDVTPDAVGSKRTPSPVYLVTTRHRPSDCTAAYMRWCAVS